MTGLSRRSHRDRHRRGPRHRPRARARAGPPGREGRGQRPRHLRLPARARPPRSPHEVVAEIEALGGEAVANGADVADFEQAAAMVQQAIDTFGGLDILVNNAGFVRDRMLVNTSEEEWDAVIRVHLKGHFAPLRHAGAYWRSEAKEGRQRAARVINTSSGAGLQGSIGQTTYSAAKAGIAGMTLVARSRARSLRRHRQRDRTGGADPDDRGRLPRDDGRRDGRLRRDGPGQQLTDRGLARLRGLRRHRTRARDRGRSDLRRGGLAARPRQDIGRRWDAGEVGAAVRELIGRAATPDPVYGA